jgi:chromate transporter
VRDVTVALGRLGVLGFGGPAAHIALMRRDLVQRRGWATDADFLDMVALTNLLPGPNSTEMAMELGRRRAGWRGLGAGGGAFILPAVGIVAGIAWAYERLGTEPALVDLRSGVLPVVAAIVAHAAWGMGRTLVAGRSAPAAAAGLATVLGATLGLLAGVHELLVLVVAGAAWAAGGAVGAGRRLAVVAVAAVAAEPTLARIALAFLRIGALLYGSGYVLVAYLEAEFVGRTGWLSGAQMLDAIAVGQMTPGPLFSSATFVGWQLAGPAGAAVATVAIFAPAFAFVALAARVVPWIRARRSARRAIDGVTAASLGLMVGAAVRLGGDALVDPLAWVVAAGALAMLAATRVGAGWLMGAGVVIGVVRLVLA